VSSTVSSLMMWLRRLRGIEAEPRSNKQSWLFKPQCCAMFTVTLVSSRVRIRPSPFPIPTPHHVGFFIRLLMSVAYIPNELNEGLHTGREA
jgi:hypothetical protein